MRCHEEYIIIEPLLVNSGCVPKQLKLMRKQWQVPSNIIGSLPSFTNNSEACLACVPSSPFLQLIQTYGSCTKFFKI